MEVKDTSETVEMKRLRLRRMVVDLIFFFVLFLLIPSVLALLLSFFSYDRPEGALNDMNGLIVGEALLVGVVLLAAWVVLRRRGIPFSRLGLSLQGRWKDCFAGVLVAVVLYAVGFGISLWIGAVSVTGLSLQLSSLLMGLLFFLLVGIAEEVMMRGFVLGRMLDGGVNKYQALLISSVLFSLLHLSNPGFEFLPFLNIVLAGILLGASYIYTRNLCFPITLHWFWNWVQGPILGYEVSGNKFQGSFLRLHLPEENLMNGGSFGFEGSLLCTFLLIAVSALIIRHYSRK